MTHWQFLPLSFNSTVLQYSCEQGAHRFYVCQATFTGHYWFKFVKKNFYMLNEEWNKELDGSLSGKGDLSKILH